MLGDRAQARPTRQGNVMHATARTTCPRTVNRERSILPGKSGGSWGEGSGRGWEGLSMAGGPIIRFGFPAVPGWVGGLPGEGSCGGHALQKRSPEVFVRIPAGGSPNLTSGLLKSKDRPPQKVILRPFPTLFPGGLSAKREGPPTPGTPNRRIGIPAIDKPSCHR
jgi:hypothetical protein